VRKVGDERIIRRYVDSRVGRVVVVEDDCAAVLRERRRRRAAAAAEAEVLLQSAGRVAQARSGLTTQLTDALLRACPEK
jgi:hypothetical protein